MASSSGPLNPSKETWWGRFEITKNELMGVGGRAHFHDKHMSLLFPSPDTCPT